jgi:2-polyprenyl-3-methyl-5-hydroxy-6-metoxy-1,4-benzoquinol methylase
MVFDCSKFLRCPDCHSTLHLENGEFTCTNCKKHFPIVQEIPRFVESESYAASFGFEWKAHRLTQLDHANSKISEQTFRAKTGLTPERIKGKLILDVGCGMGRFADVVSRWGGTVIGIDLSTAVESAHENLKARDNVAILQADVFKLPFQEKVFDFIYSIGVLHHTSNCEQAFRSLPKFLKPGGEIIIWLYDKDIVWGRSAQAYWKIAKRMNHKMLHHLCRLAGPLYYLVKLPVIGKILWRVFPIDTNPDWDWRILDTFDWYSAQYRSWHTYDQVQQWFESEGLVNVKHLPIPISVSGERADAR